MSTTSSTTVQWVLEQTIEGLGLTMVHAGVILMVVSIMLGMLITLLILMGAWRT